MFKRQGSVTVGIDKGDDYESRLEELAMAGLDNGALDFEELDSPDEQQEVEVRLPICYESSNDTVVHAAPPPLLFSSPANRVTWRK